VGSKEPDQSFVQTMSLLGDRLGALLLQLPPSFSVEGIGVLVAYAKRDRTEDLRWWSERADRSLSEGWEVFADANKHYQGHSPSTLGRFLEIRRPTR
jgi:uncharacterized protein YecE (DUF72 family)